MSRRRRAWVALVASAVGAGVAGARWKRRALAAELGVARGARIQAGRLSGRRPAAHAARLAHAHVVILGLVVLAFGSAASPFTDGDRGARLTGVLLRLGALIIPVGFAASAMARTRATPASRSRWSPSEACFWSPA